MGKNPKKGIVTEEDASVILQRYTAATVLTLLQEVSQVPDVKIDWNLLVRRTKTGITNPREYQMLWRHLAYRDELVEKLDDSVKPLDDDSDLEYELEAFPPVNNDASMEAIACVKVLLESGLRRDSGFEKGLTIEAPLMINIPTKSPISSSESQQPGGSLTEINITVPVCVQKQPLPTAPVASSMEDLDKTNGVGGGGGGNLPPRRKRKPWSEAEDMELFAAVQKCGEGNWANILKGEFKGDRTASQLSQRWNIIKKRRNAKPNNLNTLNVKTGSQLSEVHLAARRALNMALDQPGSNSLKASSLGRTKSGITSITSMRPSMPDTSTGPTIFQDQSNEDPSAPTKTFPKILPKTSPRTLVNGPDPVKAAAVAAGARIATPSAAAAILKQQLKSAIHIKTNVSSFRDLHSPNASRPLDHVGPLNPVSTSGQETNGVTVSSSANMLEKAQQDASEKEVKENAGSRVEPSVVMGICENESANQGL